MVTYEKTFVLLKQDTLKRGLAGRIIQYFEDAHLDILEAQIVDSNIQLATRHYEVADAKSWAIGVGKYAKGVFKSHHVSPKKAYGTSRALEIGNIVKEWSIQYLAEGKVMAMVIGGPHAIDKVKKIVGNTEPSMADISTIRGRFGSESIIHANSQGRAVNNIVHRATSVEEAQHQMNVWLGRTSEES